MTFLMVVLKIFAYYNTYFHQTIFIFFFDEHLYREISEMNFNSST